MRIGSRNIGPGEPPYIIAELGVNHDGSEARALDLVDAAADAHADAIKLQWFRARRLMSGSSALARYQAAAGETDPVSMLERLELSGEAMRRVVDRAHARGLHAIVTVFSDTLVPEADALDWDAYKTASPDIIHRPLLDALARTGRPIIVSTGAATRDEVARAVGWLEACRGRLTLLQCVSSYPTGLGHAAIGAIRDIAGLFDGPVGYSDHTTLMETGAIAVGCGACVLEKHLTYDHHAPGPDHAASLNPGTFGVYVRLARQAWQMMGSGRKDVQECEADVRRVSRQSLVAARDLPAGHALAPADLTIKRPGTGIEPWRSNDVLGRRLARPVGADVVITDDDLAPPGGGA